MAPDAHIGHRSPGRLRFKIPERRGDDAYFTDVKKRLLEDKKLRSVQVSPLTGSVLVQAKAIDPEAIAAVGASSGLYHLAKENQPHTPIAQRVMMPIDAVNKGIDRMTHGGVDLSSTIFLLLLGFGIYEIARGRFRPPPWYTAFWYAFGVFTKSMVDRSSPPG